jgi:hypothetical protein
MIVFFESVFRHRRSVCASFAVALFAAMTFLACSSSSGGGTPPADGGKDTGAETGHDGGPPKDAGVGLTCAKLLTCDQACSGSTCTNACYANSTAVAQGLFDIFDDCLNAECPSTPGGPCAPGSTTCSTCDQGAATAACVSTLVACEGDMHAGPPNGDAGAIYPEAGSLYNCGELNVCMSACPKGDRSCVEACRGEATPKAQSLLAKLNACIATACPATDGGPCETNGPACMGCYEQVTLAEPDTCATQYIACNSDTSNTPDAGVTVNVDGGVVTTTLTGLDQVASTLASNGNSLFFTQVLTGGPVYRLDLGDGGGIPDGGLAFADGGLVTEAGVLTALGPPEETPVSLAVDANNVYVWSVGTFKLDSAVNNKDGTLVQIPLNGAPSITLRTGIEVVYDSGYLGAVAVDATNVYWVEGALGTDGKIMSVPIGGGTPSTVYSGQEIPQTVITDGTNLYWANWGTFNAEGISNNDGTIWQGPVGGGSAMKLASNQPGTSTMAVDSNNVYWVNLGQLGSDNFPALNSGSVVKTPIGGGSVTTLATAQSVAFSILVTGGHVIWTDYGLSGPGTIMSVPTTGGTPTTLVSGLDDPSALATLGSTLYWTNANSSPTDGFILSLSPF